MLSTDLIDELERELTLADINRIQEIIEQIRDQDEELGGRLAELVDNFEHEQILDLIDRVRR